MADLGGEPSIHNPPSAHCRMLIREVHHQLLAAARVADEFLPIG